MRRAIRKMGENVLAPSSDMSCQSVAAQTEIDAAPAAVWRALTDPVELAQWFAPVADVFPGPGGRIHISWGGSFVADWLIDAWQPPRRLRVTEIDALGGGRQSGDGAAVLPTAMAAASRPTHRAIEFLLTDLGSRTKLSLRHSGFGNNATPDFVAAVRRGWDFELRSLRHYLERHAGIRRDVVWLRRCSQLSAQTIWDRAIALLTARDCGAPEQWREDEPLAIHLLHKDTRHGRVQICDPPHQLVLLVADLRDSLFRLKLAEESAGGVEVNIWLSTWGLERSILKQFERHWKPIVEELSDPTASPARPTGGGGGEDAAMKFPRQIAERSSAAPVRLHRSSDPVERISCNAEEGCHGR